jgi:dihydropteroate synthase
MFAIAAERNVPIILMHGHGPRFTKARIEDYSYEDVIREVYDYLAERIDAARAAGISEILADVGIGFAKGYGDNLTLLKHHAQFLSLSVPLVLGVSRKSTIGRAMAPPNSSTSEGGVGWGVVSPGERLIGSLAAACYGVPHGAKIIRTHDVKATREALNVIGAIITS